MRQLSSGNDDAFAVIVDRYHRLVFSVAIRIVKDEAEAEEVVQIVFLDIFRNVAKFDASRGRLKMWVLQYAYSRSVNRRRQLESRHFYSNVELDDVDTANLSSGCGRFGGLSTAETTRLVTQEFDHLSTEQRRAIDLVYFAGLEFPEVPPRQGTLGRNFVHGPSLVQLNSAIQRTFPLTERLHLLFRAEAFNLFNHPNFTLIDAFLYDPTFGHALGTPNFYAGGRLIWKPESVIRDRRPAFVPAQSERSLLTFKADCLLAL